VAAAVAPLAARGVRFLTPADGLACLPDPPPVPPPTTVAPTPSTAPAGAAVPEPAGARPVAGAPTYTA
jgi:hypothetical protein